FTIADFVADLRAPTPSAAAELAIPVLQELKDSVEHRKRRLFQSVDQKIETLRLMLKRWEGFFREPGRRLTELLLRLDHVREALAGSLEHRFEMLREKLKGIQKHLDALNPLAILERGYAVVTPAGSASPLRRAADVRAGQSLKIRLYEGELSAVASAGRDRRRGPGESG
ncbi:MAG TPA: exodeoxyribonuclease VII large subunit, partial [bacterium]|nr:exodeoxyribonuclease VII large subunit [bacterium]